MSIAQRLSLLLLLLSPLLAFGGWRQHSAYYCSPETNSAGYSTEAGQGVIARYAARKFFCPVVDDSGEIDRNLVIGMSVKVNDRDPNGSISATPCVQFYGVDGTACGSTLSTGTQFVGSANLSTGTIVIWGTYYPDFAYIYVNACRDCKIYGYSVNQ